MAIIVREERELPNGRSAVVKLYISDVDPLPGSLRKKAEENDMLLASKIEEIECDLERSGLLELRGKPGVLELWYEFGKQLKFVDDMDLGSNAKKQVWRAIYDHCSKIYPKGGVIPARIKNRPEYNDIYYSYLIGQMDWEFVKTSGEWRMWVDFLDATASREDPRIMQWIYNLQMEGPRKAGFLQDLRKRISLRFRDVVTSDLPEAELFAILDKLLAQAFEEERNE